MSYSQELEDLIDHYYISNEKLTKKKQLGGVGYLINGNMCAGIYENQLVVRLETSLANSLVGKKGIQRFVPHQPDLEGFVMIDRVIYKHPKALHKFLDHSLDFTSKLPPRKSSPDDLTLS